MLTTPNILQYVAENRLIKEYSFFIELKGLFSNSCIYNPKRLHTITGYSRTKIRRHLHIFEQQGWIHYRYGHLFFRSYSAIHRQVLKLTGKPYQHPRVIISVSTREDIQTALIENNLKQKAYVRQKVSDLLEPCNGQDYKKAKKFFKKQDGEKRYVDKGTSIKVLSNTLNYSKGHTCRIVSNLSKKRYLNKQKRITDLGRFSPQKRSALQEQYSNVFVSSGGIMYHQQTTIITSNKTTLKVEPSINTYLPKVVPTFTEKVGLQSSYTMADGTMISDTLRCNEWLDEHHLISTLNKL